MNFVSTCRAGAWALAAVFSAVATPAAAVQYSVFDMGQPARNIFATDINDLGQVVGYRIDAVDSGTSLQFYASDAHGADWRALGAPLQGQLLDFFTSGLNVKNLEITNSGQIVGTLREFTGGAFAERGFTLNPSSGHLTPYAGNLPEVDKPNQAYPTIDFSQVQNYHPGSSNGEPLSFSTNVDVNAGGQVVGWFSTRTVVNPRGFVTQANGMAAQEIDKLEFSNFSVPVNSDFSAFEFFGVPYGGINALGQFAVSSQNGHTYLLSPVPEPATALLLVAGLGVMAWSQKGRRRREKK